MKIAILSDIHGNLPALQVLLADMYSRDIQQIYCLGDLTDFAPWDNEVIALIRNLNIPCVLGNHDERIGFDQEVIPLKKHSDAENAARIAAIEVSKAETSPAHKQYLRQLPFSMRLEYVIAGRKYKLLLVHAHPDSNEKYIYAEDTAEMEALLAREQVDVLFSGHTHLSYCKAVSQGWAINPGSVGRSKEAHRKASYAILEITAQGLRPEIVQLEFDRKKVMAAIRKSAIPDFYADFWDLHSDILDGK